MKAVVERVVGVVDGGWWLALWRRWLALWRRWLVVGVVEKVVGGWRCGDVVVEGRLVQNNDSKRKMVTSKITAQLHE